MSLPWAASHAGLVFFYILLLMKHYLKPGTMKKEGWRVLSPVIAARCHGLPQGLVFGGTYRCWTRRAHCW